jgi:hypothetical protein
VDNTFPMPPPAPDPAATPTLADFVLDDSTADPVALLADGPVVVLRRSAPDRVEVFQAGHILDLADDTPATTVTDIGQSTGMIRNALTAVTQQYRYSQAQVTRLREDTDRLRSEARSIDALHTKKPSMRSDQTVSQMAWRRWVMSASVTGSVLLVKNGW